jgi:Zn-dependent oligopeptidase
VQARFNHLTIYGASYYSYLYARCLSEAIWERHLAADPLDATAGDPFYNMVTRAYSSKQVSLALCAVLNKAFQKRKRCCHMVRSWMPFVAIPHGAIYMAT